MGTFFSLEKEEPEEEEELQGLKEEVEDLKRIAVRNARDGRSYLEVVKRPLRPGAKVRKHSIRQVRPSLATGRSFPFSKE